MKDDWAKPFKMCNGHANLSCSLGEVRVRERNMAKVVASLTELACCRSVYWAMRSFLRRSSAAFAHMSEALIGYVISTMQQDAGLYV